MVGVRREVLCQRRPFFFVTVKSVYSCVNLVLATVMSLPPLNSRMVSGMRTLELLFMSTLLAAIIPCKCAVNTTLAVGARIVPAIISFPIFSTWSPNLPLGSLGSLAAAGTL